MRAQKLARGMLWSWDIENSVRPARWQYDALIARVGSVEAARALRICMYLTPDPDDPESSRAAYPVGYCDRQEWIVVQWLRWCAAHPWSHNATPTALGDDPEPIVWSSAISCCPAASDPSEAAGKWREQLTQWWFPGIRATFDYLIGLQQSSLTVAVHNLDYEAWFLFPVLHAMGWEYSSKRAPKTYSAVLGNGRVYKLTLCINQRGSKGNTWRTINLIDTNKMLGNCTLEKAAASYKLPTQKAAGDLDYSIYREPGDRITATEMGYISADVDATVELLRYLRSAQGFKEITAAGYAINRQAAFALYCTTHKTPSATEAEVLQWMEAEKLSFSQLKEIYFRDIFPKATREEDALFRAAYFGGVVYVNPRYQGERVSVNMYDVNSEYSAAMRAGRYPGQWRRRPGDARQRSREGLYIQYFTVRELHLKPGKIPTLPGNVGFMGVGSTRLFNAVYPAAGQPDLEDARWTDKRGKYRGYWALSSPDLEWMFRNYEVIGYNPVFYYDFRVIPNPFIPFIDFYYQQKQVLPSSDPKRNIVKITLNSSYGKLAARFEQEESEVIVDDDGAHLQLLMEEAEDGSKRPKMSESAMSIAAGLFVTAWARDILFRGCEAVGAENVVYTDTDSIKCLSSADTSGLDVHNSRLGAWKFEGNVTGVFMAPKQYLVADSKLDRTIGSAGYNRGDIIAMSEDEYRRRPYCWSTSSMRTRSGRVIWPNVKRRYIPELDDDEY